MQIHLGHAQEHGFACTHMDVHTPTGLHSSCKAAGGSFTEPLDGCSMLQLEWGNQPFVEGIAEVPLEQKLRLMRPSACTHAVQEYIPTNACMHACTLCLHFEEFCTLEEILHKA